MRVAFATAKVVPEGNPDDASAAALLDADTVCWDDPGVDWDAYDRVVLRSTWDYTRRPDAFLAWADRVGERLRNRVDLVRFNADKRYLAALAAPTVPTTFVAPGDPPPPLAGEVVVKPSVSAGARDTGRFAPAGHDAGRALIAAITASGRVALVQPYLERVDAEGETGLVFLGGALSHVVHKKPVLRTQGIAPVDPDAARDAAAVMFEPDLVTPATATPAQTALATAVLDEVAGRFGVPVYARVDVVTGPDGDPVLLELEAVEPALYLGTAPGAHARLAAAVRTG